jgi:hypothetical protein
MKPNFKIRADSKISIAFLERGIHSFLEACDFIGQLTYARNTNKNDLLTVFKDHCGTCSTKHAVLAQLAEDHQFSEIKLMLGIFRMNGINTPKVKNILLHYKLEYIPEAHCYLKSNAGVLDYTQLEHQPIDFQNELMKELQISPNQISTFKVAFHKEFLENWLEQNSNTPYNSTELWKIREECIQALSR